MSTAGFNTARAWAGGLWAAWLVMLGIWTFALVTPYPVQVEHEVLPAEAGYPSAKLLHVGAYTFLTAFTALLPLRGFRRWLPVLVISLHGFGTEYWQTFVPLRTGCWADVGIDHVGILLGLLLTLRWRLPRRYPTGWGGVSSHFPAARAARSAAVPAGRGTSGSRPGGS
jgi:VanZ family protein